MDDEVPRPPAAPPAEPPGSEAVTSAADELKRLIDAGAGSPEELRALAERLREHRALEESHWRTEVRPSLLQSKKRRFSLADLRDPPAIEGTPLAPPSSSSRPVGIAVGLVVLTLILLLAATQSTVLWILLPVTGVLVYAYRQGRHHAGDDAE